MASTRFKRRDEMDTIRKSYDEGLKRQIVSEVESGQLSLVDAAKEYGAHKSLIRLWLEEYGRFQPKRSVMEVVMKSERERIAELEKALADSHLKNLMYEEILNVAGKKYKVDLKKTFGTPQPESSRGTDGKSKPSAKR